MILIKRPEFSKNIYIDNIYLLYNKNIIYY